MLKRWNSAGSETIKIDFEYNKQKKIFVLFEKTIDGHFWPFGSREIPDLFPDLFTITSGIPRTRAVVDWTTKVQIFFLWFDI